jgi:hypothetical protein
VKAVGRIIFYLRNEAGVTLAESLAAITIFMLIVIPLSSSYLRGVEIFNKTEKQVAIRNEADSIIGQIMNDVQNAVYVEQAADENQELYDILNMRLKDMPALSEAKCTQSIFLYKRPANGSPALPNTLTKQLYTFSEAATAIEGAEPDYLYPSNTYVLRGLFFIDEKAQKLTVYIMLANPQKFPHTPNILRDIRNYITSNPQDITNTYFVSTSININQLKGG